MKNDKQRLLTGEALAARIGVPYPTLMAQLFKYEEEPDAILVDVNNEVLQPLFRSNRTYELSMTLFPEID